MEEDRRQIARERGQRADDRDARDVDEHGTQHTEDDHLDPGGQAHGPAKSDHQAQTKQDQALPANTVPRDEERLRRRSEERRVGKECRSRWEEYDEKEKRE